MAESFVHLHVHSHYSMMHGTSSPEQLCAAAKAAGFTHLAITDTNGFYGLINFLDAARKHGILPISGVAFQSGNEAAVVLAKTGRGYEILSDLASKRHLEKDFSLAACFPENCYDDLALLSSAPELLKALRRRAECWVEVVPGPSSRKVLGMAQDFGIPSIATNAVFFARPEDYPLHRLLRAIGCNATLSTLPPEEVAQPGQWLKPAGEIEKHFPNSPEALANSVRLAHRCYTAWDHFRTVFPHYRDQVEDHFALLLSECRKGISWRYGRSNDAVEGRLAEELDLIRAKGFVDYFLVVADIVRRRPVHCGRGSGAASLVSFLLGITHVDPIRHNLLFGRFLNPERKDLPDIDVDFPWDERDGLFEEIRGRYGDQRFALVSNHVGFGGRAALREVAKVYGVPASEIKEVTRRMSFWADPEDLPEHIEKGLKFRNFPLDPPWPEIISLAARLESIPRHLGTHCGGAVLVPDRISRYVPVQISAKGVPIIQWEKDQTEKAGLVKIDLLGNRSLAVIRDTLAAVRENTGETIEYANLDPVDDPATQELIRRGETMGVFYLESPAMRLLEKKAKRGDFGHIVIHSSIIRPAANRYITEYVRRIHGAPYEPLHPSLAELLAENYGIMVYQEDVVQAAMALAGFSWGEADGLRKVLSKKSRSQLSSYKARFFAGCAQRDVSTEVVGKIWDMIVSFSGYSFCKPHSASYALVSFKSAYLKNRYPAEFMAAVIANGGGYYSTFAYISEARRMGLAVAGPDVNASTWSYSGKDRTIRVGLQQLQNIKKSTIEALLSERKQNGPFSTVEDFLRRVPIHPSDASVLVKSGALDSIAGGLNRPQLLWFTESRVNKSFLAGRAGTPGQKTAFHLFLKPGTTRAPRLPDFSPSKKLRHEWETLGFVLSVHPLDLVAPFLKGFAQKPIPASELAHHVGRRVWTAGWPITRKEVATREGEEMEFFTFEDKTDIYETVFFPKAFRRFCQDLDMAHAYLLFGQVESEFDVVTLNVQSLHRISTRELPGRDSHAQDGPRRTDRGVPHRESINEAAV